MEKRPPSYRKQNIPSIKRAALWRVYRCGRCPYCRLPISYRDMWIEHIILEKTLKDSSEWENRKREYELSGDFRINDYENWIPVHWWCNLDRGESIWERGAAHYYLMIAKRHAEKAREEEAKLERTIKADSILSRLDVALEKGALLTEDILSFLRHRIQSEPDVNEPIVITLSVNTYGLGESYILPDEVFGLSYVGLCDWLEKDLLKGLSSVLSSKFYYSEASDRNGETLSVRLYFVGLDWDEFDKFDSKWWEILEIACMSEIYPEEAN